MTLGFETVADEALALQEYFEQLARESLGFLDSLPIELTASSPPPPERYHNVCEHLRIVPNRPLFPRGFPFRLRGESNATHVRFPARGTRVGVTAGLWAQRA